MTPEAITPDAGPRPVARWLQQVAEAADELERRLGGGEPALFTDAGPAPHLGSSAALPAADLDRAQAVLARLQRLSLTVERRRDAVAVELAGLGRARPRARSGSRAGDDYAVGSTLDVAG